jgi:intron-binding protein aquarius
MTVDEVARPKIGEVVPGKVISTITIDISRFSGSVLDEWESLNEHDVIFLISFGTLHWITPTKWKNLNVKRLC